jgi:hypothetical protein
MRLKASEYTGLLSWRTLPSGGAQPGTTHAPFICADKQ